MHHPEQVTLDVCHWEQVMQSVVHQGQVESEEEVAIQDAERMMKEGREEGMLEGHPASEVVLMHVRHLVSVVVLMHLRHLVSVVVV